MQSIDNYTFNVDVYCEENFIEMGVLTDIALLPGMITVTDEAGQSVIPSQKTAIGVEINDGIRTYSCYIEFAKNIPAGTTYNVIFTVSGQIIHTETVTVPVTEYTVTFSGTKMEPITFNEYTEEIRLPHYTGEPGMICKGWDTDSAAETVVYEDGGIIPKEKLTGNIVLYPILEEVQITLTYIKNGAEAYPAYEYYMFPETAYYKETMQISEMMFYKNDGTDTPWILSGIRVTETDNPSVTLTVTPGNDERSGSYWEYTAGDKPLTVELLWEEQSISNPSFEVKGSGSSSRENYLHVACLTNIALSPGMITVTDETGTPVIPSQKMATCAQIKDGIRTYYCFLEFSTNIPDGTYKVIFTVSGQIIHTETITVPEASETVTVPEPQP